MKSEERHKLQQNELADYLARFVEKIKPYQNAILGGVVLILVIVLLVHWWNGKTDAAQQAANTEIYNAMGAALSTGDPSELAAVAEKYFENPAAAEAALTAADIHLNNGCNLIFVNKAKANAELGDAVDLYQKWLPRLKKPFMIAQAKFGFARAEECQNQLPEAKKHYDEIVKSWPDSSYGVLAARRLEDIERPATKEMYDKLANFDPKPFKDDTGGLSDKMPLFDPSNLPEEPIIKSGTLGEKLNLNTESKDGAKSEDLLKEKTPPAGEPPAKDEKKPDETKPDGGSRIPPEPAKPAEGEKPAEEKPAATPPAPEIPAPSPTPAATTTPPAAATPAPAPAPPAAEKPAPAVNNK